MLHLGITQIPIIGIVFNSSVQIMLYHVILIDLKKKTLSHLSVHVVNRLLRGNRKSIPKIFNC